jgi:hypothetical protein
MYPEVRIIFLDGTNVDMKHKPSAAHAESLANSLHYGRNVAKGGVGLQMCWELSGLQQVIPFIRQDVECSRMRTDSKAWTLLPFLNILDKGYRVTAHAFRSGKETN